MAKIFILDDEQSITLQYQSILQDIGHTIYFANDVNSFLDMSDELIEESIEIDLYIFDHELGGGETSLFLFNIMLEEDNHDFENKFIVATAHALDNITLDYAKYGSLGHLIKPIHQSQLIQTVNHALAKIEYIRQQKYNWEDAFEILEAEGFLDSLNDLEKDNNTLRQQYDALVTIYQSLLDNLKGKYGEDITRQYDVALDAVNKLNVGFDVIYKYSDVFDMTENFLDDARSIMKDDKLVFLNLINFLAKIKNNPFNYRQRKLEGADSLYEYYLGRNHSYRLYFKKNEGGVLRLERFGHKNVQNKIIDTLRKD